MVPAALTSALSVWPQLTHWNTAWVLRLLASTVVPAAGGDVVLEAAEPVEGGGLGVRGRCGLSQPSASPRGRASLPPVARGVGAVTRVTVTVGVSHAVSRRSPPVNVPFPRVSVAENGAGALSGKNSLSAAGTTRKMAFPDRRACG